MQHRPGSPGKAQKALHIVALITCIALSACRTHLWQPLRHCCQSLADIAVATCRPSRLLTSGNSTVGISLLVDVAGGARVAVGALAAGGVGRCNAVASTVFRDTHLQAKGFNGWRRLKSDMPYSWPWDGVGRGTKQGIRGQQTKGRKTGQCESKGHSNANYAAPLTLLSLKPPAATAPNCPGGSSEPMSCSAGSSCCIAASAPRAAAGSG